MTQAGNPPQKQILEEGPVQTLKAGFWSIGQGVLTMESFAFLVRGYAIFNSFGLLGALINRLFPVRVATEIPLSSITAIGRGRFGLLKNVFAIETTEGKKQQFQGNYQSWLRVIKEVLQAQGARLVQTGDERWEVQR